MSQVDPSLERELLSAAAAQITTKRAVIEGTTYAIANITSVSVVEVASQRPALIVLALAGVGGAIFGFLSESPTFSKFAGFFALLGVVLAVIAKPKYGVSIGTAGAEKHALVTKDRAFATKVSAALNEAITRRT